VERANDGFQRTCAKSGVLTVWSPNSLEEIKQLWQREPDNNVVFRAATRDIEEYPPEIQTVIKEEAERRRRALEQEQEREKAFVVKRVLLAEGLGRSIGLCLAVVIPSGILSLVFGSEVWGMAAIMIVAALIKIWKPKKFKNPDDAETPRGH
jgi:hypothetical protein